MSNAGTNANNRNSATNDDDENRLGQQAQDAVDTAEDTYEEGVSEIRRALSRLEDEVTDLYDMIAERSADSIEAVEEAVQAYPWYSLGVAFLAGCVTTLLLGRRR
jgi:ElaB/YqjD/DUF883 family membrane-anchored ribosome-binding protein